MSIAKHLLMFADSLIAATSKDAHGTTTGIFLMSSPLHTGNSDHQLTESPPLTPLIRDHDMEAVKSISIVRQRKSHNGSSGILKKPKEIDWSGLKEIPEPIQRSARLSCKELRRLTPLPRDPSLPPRVSLVTFKDTVEQLCTFSREEYDRGCCDFVARSLTPAIALAIKRELNEVKQEMPVHPDSASHTQLYKV